MSVEDQIKETSANSKQEELFVKDKRRINLDNLNSNQPVSKPDDPPSGALDALSDKSSTKEEANNWAPDSRELSTLNKQLEMRAQAAENKLIEVQKRFDQLRTEMQRDLEATRLRLNKAAEEKILSGKAEFIKTLIPVLDNLHRAIEAAAQVKHVEVTQGPEDFEKAEPESLNTLNALDGLVDGLRGTINGFEVALVAAGVEPIASVGMKFNPEFHEALDTIGVEPERDGIVTAEYSRGYKLGDRLLNPARVQVGRTGITMLQEI